MKGDITRSTFNKAKHHRRVLMQQGRVQLDADWNEQVDIDHHLARTSWRDLVGHHGTPASLSGLKIRIEENNATYIGSGDNLEFTNHLTVDAGRYYIDGVLIELEGSGGLELGAQPDLPDWDPGTDLGLQLGSIPDGTTRYYLIYLHTRQQLVTALDDPEVMDPALGGLDTAARSKTLCQVRFHYLGTAVEDDVTSFGAPGGWLPSSLAPSTGTLKFEAAQSAQIDTSDPCIVPSNNTWRRLDNQLYRIEIHDLGGAGSAPRFKWSRNNASIVCEVVSAASVTGGTQITLGGVQELVLKNVEAGQLVEFKTAADRAMEAPGRVGKVAAITGNLITVEWSLGDSEPSDFTGMQARFWDCGALVDVTDTVLELRAGSGVVTDPQTQSGEGLTVTFENVPYRPGDYWQAAVRSAANEGQTAAWTLEWPQSGGNAVAIPPMGPERLYAPLAQVAVKDAGFDEYEWDELLDLRKLITPLTELDTLLYVGGDGQSALPGSTLSKPIEVAVVTGPEPVAGQALQFKLLAGSGEGELTANVASGTTELEPPFDGEVLIVQTNSKGEAAVDWKLSSTSSLGPQQVSVTRAYQATQGGPWLSVGAAVRFTAQPSPGLKLYPSLESFLASNSEPGALGYVREGNEEGKLSLLYDITLTNTYSKSIATSGEWVYFCAGNYVYRIRRDFESIDAAALSSKPNYNHEAIIYSVFCDGHHIYIGGAPSSKGGSNINVRQLTLELEDTVDSIPLQTLSVNSGGYIFAVHSDTVYLYWCGGDTTTPTTVASKYGWAAITDFNLWTEKDHATALYSISASNGKVLFAGYADSVDETSLRIWTPSLSWNEGETAIIDSSDEIEAKYRYQDESPSDARIEACWMDENSIWIAGGASNRHVVHLWVDHFPSPPVITTISEYSYPQATRNPAALAYDGKRLYVGLGGGFGQLGSQGVLLQLDPWAVSPMAAMEFADPINDIDLDCTGIFLAAGKWTWDPGDEAKAVSRVSERSQVRLVRRCDPTSLTRPYKKLVVPDGDH